MDGRKRQKKRHETTNLVVWFKGSCTHLRFGSCAALSILLGTLPLSFRFRERGQKIIE